jgi:hypothetical protein
MNASISKKQARVAHTMQASKANAKANNAKAKANKNNKDRRTIFTRPILMFALTTFFALVLRQFHLIAESTKSLSQTYDELAFREMLAVSPNNIATNEHATKTTTKTTTNNKNKPRLVLHIGPPKTGTSSIQCGLVGLNQTLVSLDNYYYLGKPCGDSLGEGNDMLRLAYVFLSLNQRAELGEPPPDDLVQSLNRHLELGHNVIMSSENWGLLGEDNAFNLLLSCLAAFDVTIVNSYRYYHEWLPSVYFQQKHGPKGFTVTPTFENYMDTLFFLQVDYEDVDDNILNTTTATATDGVLLTRMVREHQTVAPMLRYLKHFDNVVIFDMHGPNGGGVDDLITSFVCRALPTAKKTCQLLQLQQRQQGPKKNAQRSSTTHARSSTEMESIILTSFVMFRLRHSPKFSILFSKLLKKWKKSKRLTKKKLISDLAAPVERIFRERYFPSRKTAAAGEERIPPTVPMTCPSVEKLDKLLRMSIASDKFITSRREWQDMYYNPKVADDADPGPAREGAVVGSNYTEMRLTRNSYIRERFAKSVAEQKFCSIDLKAIQSDPFWIDFLDSLDVWVDKLLLVLKK